MERDVIEARKREIEARYGAWSAHSFQLRDDLYTIAPDAHWNHASRLRRVVQLVTGLAQKPVPELRILDLGALEGLFSVEFARRGAQVVAVEGRQANAEKIRLAKDALGLDNLEVRQEDVRGLAPESHGHFDVVLALGIVCLFDVPEVFAFLEGLRELCGDLLVLEADTAPIADEVVSHRGRRYFGTYAPGDRPDADPLSEVARWTALGNGRSFRLSAASLGNALADTGFPLVLQCHVPVLSYNVAATPTYVALAREPTDVVAVPAFAGHPLERIEERRVPWTTRAAARARPLVRRAVPQSLRPSARRIVARVLETQ